MFKECTYMYIHMHFHWHASVIINRWNDLLFQLICTRKVLMFRFHVNICTFTRSSFYRKQHLTFQVSLVSLATNWMQVLGKKKKKPQILSVLIRAWHSLHYRKKSPQQLWVLSWIHCGKRGCAFWSSNARWKATFSPATCYLLTENG